MTVMSVFAINLLCVLVLNIILYPLWCMYSYKAQSIYCTSGSVACGNCILCTGSPRLTNELVSGIRL